MGSSLKISDSSRELLAFLQCPKSYPNRPDEVTTIETHISWIFLAGKHAYKLKKPVRLGFLDFSTLEKRKEACEAELRLNQRLSPTVYRAVVPVVEVGSRLQIGNSKVRAGVGSPRIIDWLVRMRRLDDAFTLQQRITDGRAEDIVASVRQVASKLATFYATQAPITVRTSAYRELLLSHIEDNYRQLLDWTSDPTQRDTIRLVHSRQRRFLGIYPDVFDNRVRDGRIVDGHGDLRPEHIYLYRSPVIIDCIEFSKEYRSNDIADELAFLAMECDRQGFHSAESILFDAYANESQDIVDRQLIAFYKSYRACVRAKVAAIRVSQQRDEGLAGNPCLVTQYLDLAKSYRMLVGQRLLVLVGGLMGTGKTTLANELRVRLDAELISTDTVRRASDVTAVPEPENGSHRPFSTGSYTDSKRLRVYECMLREAQTAFERNDVVVLDGTFSQSSMRELAFEFAGASQATVLQVECQCPIETAKKRIRDRSVAGETLSEARPEFVEEQVRVADPPSREHTLVTVNTTLPMGLQVAIALERLTALMARAS